MSHLEFVAVHFHGGDMIFLKKSSEAEIPPQETEHLNLFSVDVLSGQEEFHFFELCAVLYLCCHI